MTTATFLVESAIARQNLQRMNTMIQEIANRYGQLVDLHAHFLTGDLSWTQNWPSLKGASEVRRASPMFSAKSNLR